MPDTPDILTKPLHEIIADHEARIDRLEKHCSGLGLRAMGFSVHDSFPQNFPSKCETCGNEMEIISGTPYDSWERRCNQCSTIGPPKSGKPFAPMCLVCGNQLIGKPAGCAQCASGIKPKSGKPGEIITLNDGSRVRLTTFRESVGEESGWILRSNFKRSEWVLDSDSISLAAKTLYGPNWFCERVED